MDFRGLPTLSSLRLSLLGTLALERPDGQPEGATVAQPKRFALLAYLALARPRGWQRRDAVVAMFWPESTQERARRALRDAVYVVRRDLGDAVIEGRGSEEVRLAPDVGIDAVEFEDAVARGDLAEALELYRGDLMPAFHLGDLPEFGQWLDLERSRLRRMATEAARSLRDQLAATAPLEAGRLAERALELSEGEAADAARLAELERAADARGRALPPAPGELPPPSSTPADRGAVVDSRSGPPRSRARLLLAAGGLLLVAVMTGIAWQRARPVDAGPRTTLVLPFTVHGGESVQYLGDGMMDLLTAKLDGVGGVRVVDPQSVHAAVRQDAGASRDLAAARRVSSRFGRTAFVMGSIVEAGGRLQVSAYLYDHRGEELARAEAVAPVDDLFRVLDGIARELLVGFLTGPDGEVAKGAALSTASLPALREYLVGEQALRSGDFATAHDAFARATTLDTAFALAYYRLSGAADWLGRAEDAHAAIRAAARHRERLSGTDRLLVDARVDFWLGDAAEAERRYRRIVALRPTSVEAWYELAEVHFHGGPWMGRSMLEAIPAFREVLRLMPTHASAMLHLARLGALQRDVRLVDSLTEVLTVQEPGHARLAELHLLRSGLRAGPERLPAARAALDAVDVTSRAMAVDRMAVYTGDRAGALALARPLTEDGVLEFARRAGLEISAHLAAGLGQWAEAEAMLGRLAEVDPLRAAQARALAVIGVAPAADSNTSRAAVAALRAAPAAEELARTDSNLRMFASLRESFYLGALAGRLGDTVAVERAVAILEATAAGADDDAIYARHLAGLLRALEATRRGDPATALGALEASWPPPRRTIMVRWAWNHTVVLARVLRAETLLALGRHAEARAWATSAIEDIAGTPLLQSRIDRVLAAASDQR